MSVYTRYWWVFIQDTDECLYKISVSCINDSSVSFIQDTDECLV